jgi:photosystem II stability/assembly factor-like uncharacterized protein
MKDAPCTRRCAAWWAVLGFLLLALALGGCSSSSGVSWQGLGLSGKQVKSLAFGPANSQTILAGTSGQGLFRSLDNGDSWAADTTGLSSGLTVNSIVLDASQSILYLGTDQGVFQSDDDGDHWKSSSQGLPAGAAGAVTTLYFNIADSTLYAGTAGAGIFISHDGAKTWSASGQGLPAGAAVHALLAGRQAQNPRLYAALAGAGVYQSSDGGQSWSASNTGLPPGVDGLSLLTQPSGPGGLYVGTSAGVYRSMDNGNTWHAVNEGLGQPPPPVYALALNEQNPIILFAGTDSGLYTSADGGAHWGRVAPGLPSGQGVMAIVVQGNAASLGLLYVGVDNVYRYPSEAAATSSRIVEVIIIVVLVIALLLLFYQQRRMMQRLLPKPPAQPEAPRRGQSVDSMLAQRRAEILRAAEQRQSAEPADEPGVNGAEPKKPS